MNPALRTAEGHYTLAALDAFAWMLTPVWVFDLTVPTILWANAAALELWEARDLAELQARDFSDLTDTTRQRLARALAEIRDGRTCAEQWTFYPKGRPVHLIVNLTGIVLSDGRLTTLHEARPVVPEQPDPLALRGIEALTHTPVMITLHDAEGRVLMQNPAAQRSFGITDAAREQLRARCADPLDAASLLDALEPEAGWVGEIPRLTTAGLRWHRVKAHRTTDPVTGAAAVLVSEHDVHELHEARTRLAHSEARLRSIVEGVAAVLWEVELPSGRLSYVSPQIEQLSGYPSTEWYDPQVWLARIDAEDREHVRCSLSEQLAAGRDGTLEYRLQRADGSLAWWRTHFRVQRGLDGRPLRAIGFLLDISDRVATEERLRVAELVFDHADQGIFVTDAEQRIRYVNPAFETISGYGAGELLGQTPRLLRSGHQDERFYAEMWSTLRRDGRWRGELWNRRRNGDLYAQQLTIRAVPDPHGRSTRYLALASDVTEQRQRADRLQHLALHDALTGLPNRKLLNDRLAQAVRLGRRESLGFALIALDLDGFKGVNDTWGHAAGDRLLRSAGRRLTNAVRASDTVARLGGDEFSVLLWDIAGRHDAEAVAAKLLAALRRSFSIDGHTVQIGASFGVALYPQDGADAATLTVHADAALYRAKSAGRNLYAFYTPTLEHEAHERNRLEEALRRLLDGGALAVAIQPEVDLADGRITGAELLARWPDADTEAPVPPARFIAVAEECGLIAALSEAVLQRALGLLRAWQPWLPRGFRLSVNLSPALLRQGEAQPLCRRVLAGEPALAAALMLDLPERGLFAEDAATRRRLHALRALGPGLALDDFGQGTLPLAGLREGDFDVLKITRALVAGLDAEAAQSGLAAALLGLGQALGLPVIAKGVETAAQARALRALGCTRALGFHFAPPLTPEAFSGLLAGGHKLPPS